MAVSTVTANAASRVRPVLDQINLKVEDAGDERRVSLTVPPQPFSATYEALDGNDPSRPDADGIWKGSLLRQGPENEVVPSSPTRASFVIHFSAGDQSRDQHEAYLATVGEKAANPFLVALAEATSLTQKGESLFKYNDSRYVVRTEKANTKTGAQVGAVSSIAVDSGEGRDGVVGGVAHFDGEKHPSVVIAGSPKPRN